MIKILQIGLGPLGQKIGKFIVERKGIETIAAVDKNLDLAGQDLGNLLGLQNMSINIEPNIFTAIQKHKPDIAVVSTVSSLKHIVPTLEEIIKQGIPVVSTCEELCYPWEADVELANQLDELAKKHQVALVGTGVNPGFLMDALPTFLTAVCQQVDFVQVKRFQNARYRRLPFQQKIGVGLSLDKFEQQVNAGTLRHVGLTESMQFIARSLGWQLAHTEDIIEPVIAYNEVTTPAYTVPKGHALGVLQTGQAYVKQELKIELQFKAAIGIAESFDAISIKGTPNIQSTIAGGVNGDIATCAIIINTIPQLLRSSPGLKTMADIPLVACFS